MPWVNVIANPHFGTVVTASGSAHTWSGNSRENRLTPFANDPISDPTSRSAVRAGRRHGRRVVAARRADGPAGQRADASCSTRPA